MSRCARVGVVRRRAAIDAERQRNQRVAEKPASYLRERQNADDPAAALGEKVMRAMAKHILDDLAPPDAVEESRLRTSCRRTVPIAARPRERTRARRCAPPLADRRPTAARRYPSSGTVEKNTVDAIPSEVRHQAAQSRLHALEVEVVAKSRLRADAFTRG